MKKIICMLAIFAGTLGITGASYAQVDVARGSCVDLSCQKRVMQVGAQATTSSSTTITNSGGTSSTSSGSSGTCSPSSYANPPEACLTGYTGTRMSYTTVSCPSGEYGAPMNTVSAYDDSACVQSLGSGSTAAASPAPQQCKKGYGSTSAGDPGYCNDCDNIMWHDSSFAANQSAAQRACYTAYGPKESRVPMERATE